jgi:hypothetical protein
MGLKREVGGRNIVNSLFESYGKKERKGKNRKIVRLFE